MSSNTNVEEEIIELTDEMMTAIEEDDPKLFMESLEGDEFPEYAIDVAIENNACNVLDKIFEEFEFDYMEIFERVQNVNNNAMKKLRLHIFENSNYYPVPDWDKETVRNLLDLGK